PTALTSTGAANVSRPTSTCQSTPSLRMFVAGTPSQMVAPSRSALRRNAVVVRAGCAAPSRRDTTPPGQLSATAGTRRRNSVPSISSMGEAERVQFGDARATGFEFGVVLGDQHLAVAFEPAAI